MYRKPIDVVDPSSAHHLQKRKRGKVYDNDNIASGAKGKCSLAPEIIDAGSQCAREYEFFRRRATLMFVVWNYVVIDGVANEAARWV